MFLQIHDVIRGSEVNGPGDRYVVWTQGCSKHCKGCYNPEMWDASKGHTIDTQELANDILSSGCEGLTLSGGDPLEQPEALYDLLTKLHIGKWKLSPNLKSGIICFTGYTLEEVKQNKVAKKCLKGIDLLIDGRYNQSSRLSTGIRGSANQRFIFLNKPNRGREIIDEIVIDHSVEVHDHTSENFTYKSDNCSVYVVTGFPDMNDSNMEALEKLGIKLIE